MKNGIQHTIAQAFSNHTELSYNELCSLFADEYREEYEQITGEDTRNTGYSAYTTNEQISRYSKRLAFWEIKLDELDDPVFYSPNCITSCINKRMFFMKNIERVDFRMEDNFTNEIKMKIRQAADKLRVSARNNI